MATPKRIIFKPFALDPTNECLWLGSQAIKLRPKAFAVLHYLVDRPGQLVTKDELLSAIWPETFVTDAVLKVTIGQLRDVLKDDSKTPRFIETAHRRGYRFIGSIGESAPQIAPDDISGSFSTASIGVVGRDQALARMGRWLQKMLRGERQIVFVTGEAGIGKTSLVDAFSAFIPADGSVRVGRGQCLEQYGTSEAYLPVLEAIGRLCREEQKVLDVVRAHAPMWLLQMPWLLNSTDRELLSKQVSGASRERMLREIGGALAALTDDVPLVLILEDLHWSDYSTLDLISYLAAKRDSAKLMLIGTYRNVELIVSGHPLKAVKQEMLAKQQCKELPVEYLNVEAVSQYLSSRFPYNSFPNGLAELIHERTDGNPLFMVNAVDYLQATQLIKVKDQRWELTVDIANVQVGVPDNIKQMIEKQVEHLGEEKQSLLEAASVAGVEFSALALAAGLEEELSVVEDHCNELARQRHYLKDCGVQELPNGEIVSRYGFVHALYQNVLYERLPVSRRVQLHRLIGERGEEVYGERVKDIAGELAMHFERGRDFKRAARYLQQAADKAIRQFAYEEAVGLARSGIALLEKLPDTPDRINQELCLHLTLGVPLIAIEGYASPNVGAVYLKARELYEQIGDTPDVSEVLWGVWTFHTLRAELETAREIAEEFLRLAERLPYPGLAMRGHWALEITFTHLGQFGLALDHFEKALSLYEPEHHREDSFLYALNPGVAMPCFAAWALWCLGYPDQALERIDEAVALARELAEPHGLAHACFFAAMLHHFRRAPSAAEGYVDFVLEIASERGLALYQAMANVIKGWVMFEQGQQQAGIERLREGLAALEVTGTLLVRPYFLAVLAEALAKMNEIEEALTLVDEAITLINRHGERYCEAELYRLKGELLFKQATGFELSHCNTRESREFPEVESSFKQSIEIAERQSANSWQLRSTMSLARLYECTKREGEVSDLLVSLYERFTEGFDTSDLKDAKGMLDNLHCKSD